MPMTIVALYSRDGEVVVEVASERGPAVIMYGSRSFAPDTDGRYVEVTSVDQPVVLPANIPPPAVGAVN